MDSNLSFLPYRLIEQRDDFIRLKLKNSQLAVSIFVFRVLPILLLILASWIFVYLREEIPVWLNGLILIGTAAISFFLLRFKIISEIILKKFSFGRAYISFFSKVEESIPLSANHRIEVRSMDSESAIDHCFYLIGDNLKMKLFNFSTHYVTVQTEVNNFIKIIREYCKIRVEREKTN
ncbi:MAG: hypothetical protein H3C39_05085 [Flavobacteriia bacterium]|nr:hypothetical protein [Flavobacteriia bacterium]